MSSRRGLTDHDAAAVESLGKSAARGAGLGMVSQLVRFAAQIAGIAILGRLLLADDYGLIAMVLAIVGLGEILRDAGLGAAAVQSSTITQTQKSVLFWINTGIGVLLTLVIYLLAEPISSVYSDPRIAAIVQALSITFLINGLAAQFRAQLIRDRYFGRIAVVEVAGTTLGIAAALVAALSNYGYWALVLQQILQAILFFLGFMIYARWIPGLPRRGVRIGQYVRFGAGFMSTQILVYLSANLSSLIIGARFGATDTGFYNRAFQLCTLPLNQVSTPASNVSLATLSRLQHDDDRFMRFAVRGQLILSSFAVSAYVIVFVCADSLVAIALGPGWEPAVPILRAMVIGGIFQSLGFTAYWIFTAKGWTGSNFRFALVTRSTLIILVIGGSIVGPVEAALAYSIGIAAVWPCGLFWLKKIHGVDIGLLLTTGLRTISVFTVGGVLIYMATTEIKNTYLEIMMAFVVTILNVALMCTVFASVRADFKSLITTAKLLRGRTTKANGGSERE
ncbi:lipopolysaccharide biosynthesis protein [Rhodococcoides fascians]|uniref:lipopolysaccharide biosynthesis protein n=1 Tax=Rhodococcoides fascians TaxID=1828 RepID=UPI000AFAA00A|nr:MULTISPECIES: lipopolysaccharide biosynthesis protein [Rhodococcus]OZF03142.1 hypothetical protein CH301_06745 [Rhodococcus sp. 15-1189-1-1a]